MIENFIEVGKVYQFNTSADWTMTICGQVISVSENWVLIAGAYWDTKKIYRVNHKLQTVMNLNNCFYVSRINCEVLTENDS